MIIHNLLLASDRPGPDYLFKSSTQTFEFLFIESNMQQLNDYCVICDQAATKQLSIWEERLEDDETEDEWPDAGFEFFGWRKSQETVVAGMALILLSTFVEKELKALCRMYANYTVGRVRPKRSESQVEAYIDFLRNNIGLTFQEPQESIEAREMARKLRNEFAHGDWDKFQASLTGVDLSRAFGAASALFRAIEGADGKPEIEWFA